MALAKYVHQAIYRHRLLGKRIVSTSARFLPERLSRRLRAFAEQVAYRVVPEYQGDTLPPIFHFWSNQFVRPVVEALGFSTPEQMYYLEIRKAALAAGRTLEVVSLGAGACGLEIDLASRLRSEGIAIRMECVDSNAHLLKQARLKAEAAGLAEVLEFSVRDCNQPMEMATKDVVVVNQFFHHLERLEPLCESLRQALAPSGRLLTCDMVGRNGHAPWPSVDAKVQAHWARLDAGQRFDRYFGKATDRYVPVDHSAYSNEGVRAQDIVGCLSRHFDFELFVTFGGAIVPFVERRIGFNFDPGLAGDRDFIDGVAREDAMAIEAGEYPASNMIAVLRSRGSGGGSVHVPISPERHVALTREQAARAPGRGAQGV